MTHLITINILGRIFTFQSNSDNDVTMESVVLLENEVKQLQKTGKISDLSIIILASLNLICEYCEMKKKLSQKATILMHTLENAE